MDAAPPSHVSLTVTGYRTADESGGAVVTQTGRDREEPRPYLSYLLRLWQAGDAGPEMWRAYVESIQSRERVR